MARTDRNVFISIVMPVYNAEKHISQALDSIAAQSFQNYELLLVDALSSDSTIDIIQEKQATDHRIRLVSEQDKGIYDAMNKGIQLANGEWVYFMGSDDSFFTKDVLEKVATYLSDDKDLVYGNVMWMPEEIIETGECDIRLLMNRNINHQRIFYSKALFKSCGGFDLQYKVASDHELNIRFFSNRQIRKMYIPITIACYQANGFSSNKLDEAFWNNWKIIFSKNLAQHLPEKEMYHKLGWYCRFHIGRRNYAKAFRLFWDVFFHTLSPGFVYLTMRHFLQSVRKHAS